jgi:hypothetical protein
MYLWDTPKSEKWPFMPIVRKMGAVGYFFSGMSVTTVIRSVGK